MASRIATRPNFVVSTSKPWPSGFWVVTTTGIPQQVLTALVNAASLARQAPAVYVVEDAHWIDEVSESMLADFLKVIPQTAGLVLVTYRPEYRGALARGGG